MIERFADLYRQSVLCIKKFYVTNRGQRALSDKADVESIEESPFEILNYRVYLIVEQNIFC